MGGIGAFLGFHGDEGANPGGRARSFLVHDDVDFGDGTMLGEKILQVVLDDVEGKIPDV